MSKCAYCGEPSDGGYDVVAEFYGVRGSAYDGPDIVLAHVDCLPGDGLGVDFQLA